MRGGAAFTRRKNQQLASETAIACDQAPLPCSHLLQLLIESMFNALPDIRHQGGVLIILSLIPDGHRGGPLAEISNFKPQISRSHSCFFNPLSLAWLPYVESEPASLPFPILFEHSRKRR